MRRPSTRSVVRVVEAAVAVLLVCAFSAAAAQSHAYFRKAKREKVPAYAVKSSAGPKKPVFDIKAVAPGDQGRAAVSLQNVGTKNARISAKRIKRTASPIDPYLIMSVYDRTTKACLYPRPKMTKQPKPRPGQRPTWPKPSGPCRAMAQWTKLPASMALAPKPVGKFVPVGFDQLRWKPKEKHVLEIRWMVRPTAPNSVAGRTSSYVVRWRATK